MTAEGAYYLMATFAFPIAAGWALFQWHQSVRQRQEELRWKKAEAAWQLLDKVFEDRDTDLAFEVIDGERDSLDVPGEGMVPVSIQDVERALALGDEDVSAKARMIRYSFNCVLYAFERLESAIRSRYVVEGDVCSPTRYYARQLCTLHPVLAPYAREVGYDRALALIVRLGRDGGTVEQEGAPARPANPGGRSGSEQ